MSALDEDTLRRLALGRTGTAPAAPRALSEIRHRAARIRRTRMAIGTGLATGLAGVVTAVVVAAVPGGHREGTTVVQTPAAAPTGMPTASRCAGGTGTAIGFDQIPHMLRLPPADVAKSPLVLAFARSTSTAPCERPAPVAAIWYAMTGGVVTARLQVEGPGASDGYRSVDAAAGSASASVAIPVPSLRTTQETLGNRQVTLHQPADPSRDVIAFWTEPDGGTWKVTGQGLDADAVRSAVTRIAIRDGRVDPTSRPAVLPDTVAGTATPTPEPDRSLYAMYGSERQDQGGWEVQVREGTGGDWPAQMGSRAVDVGDRTGWLTSGEQSYLEWPCGDSYRCLVVGLPDVMALKVARSLVAVRPDDSRLLAAKETVAADQTTDSAGAATTSTS